VLVEAPSMEVGNVLVTTTKNKGHSIEFWADSAANRIVSVGGNCHPLIAQQAEAFKEDVKKVVAFYLAEAVKSDRTTLIAELENQGHQDMADILRRL
tara:strand:+ start:164 stop:454 length:291 start_codon:yes stop_codon:yes gene_type:complete